MRFIVLLAYLVCNECDRLIGRSGQTDEERFKIHTHAISSRGLDSTRFDYRINTMAQRCKNLVLDSGPLLSLSPLRGLADTYFTVPQVLDELKDKRAREHFEQLGLSTGVRVKIRSPDPASLAHGTCQVY